MLSKTSTSRNPRTVEIRINPATGKRFTKAELIATLATPGTLYARQLTRYTLADLQQQIDDRERFNKIRYAKQEVPTGSVHRHDFQADIYGGQYKVTGYDTTTGVYTVVSLPPDDTTIEAIITAVVEGHYYVAPGEDRAAKAEEEIQDRIAQAGRESKVRFISAAAYAEYF